MNRKTNISNNQSYINTKLSNTMMVKQYTISCSVIHPVSLKCFCFERTNDE